MLQILCINVSVVAAGPIKMAGSPEFKLRQYLFNRSLPYDKNVRPVSSSLGPMIVQFGLQLNKIVKVVSSLNALTKVARAPSIYNMMLYINTQKY